MTQPFSHSKLLPRDAFRALRVKLGLRREVSSQPPPQEAATTVSYHDVGVADALRSGWFNQSKRELFNGFPINSEDTVLDVGCGLGGNLKFCAQFAKHVIGIDIDPDRVKLTEKLLRDAGLNNYQVIASDGNPLPLESSSIDKVVCTEVLEHVDDPMVTMRELVRVGRPGALFMLSVPGQLSEEVMKDVAPPSCFEKPNHIRVFSSDDFEKLVIDAGLIIERHEPFSFYWAVWHAIIWKCGVDYEGGKHPVLDHWALTWQKLLELPDGDQCINTLNKALHKSQIIVARKPLQS